MTAAVPIRDRPSSEGGNAWCWHSNCFRSVSSRSADTVRCSELFSLNTTFFQGASGLTSDGVGGEKNV